MAPAVNRIVHHLMVDRIFVVKIRKRFHVSAIERFDPASQYICWLLGHDSKVAWHTAGNNNDHR